MTREELRERLKGIVAAGEECRAYPEDTVAAILSALREEGLAVVNREPSEAMLEAVSDQAWACGYCTERPQQMHGGGSALFTNEEVAPMARAMLAAGDLLGGKDAS